MLNRGRRFTELVYFLSNETRLKREKWDGFGYSTTHLDVSRTATFCIGLERQARYGTTFRSRSLLGHNRAFRAEKADRRLLRGSKVVEHNVSELTGKEPYVCG